MAPRARLVWVGPFRDNTTDALGPDLPIRSSFNSKPRRLPGDEAGNMGSLGWAGLCMRGGTRCAA